MPELPEVEIIRRQLEEYLVGQLIVLVELRNPEVFKGDSQLILNSPITTVRRRGKGLIIDFENNNSLGVHVKMTGQLIYEDFESENAILSDKVGMLPGKHTHVVFKVKNQNSKNKKQDVKAVNDLGISYLYYNDIRRFGWMRVGKRFEIDLLPFFATLGPDIFSPRLTVSYFFDLLQKSKMPVKTFLMDQRRIAGVGNIYANDALWDAGLDPRRPACSFSPVEAQRLHTSMQTIMKKSIELGAASDNNYVDALGQEGEYQNHFLVYGRAGEKCFRCKSIISRTVVGGRGTFVCEVCQK